jgi:hypothetical protein
MLLSPFGKGAMAGQGTDLDCRGLEKCSMPPTQKRVSALLGILGKTSVLKDKGPNADWRRRPKNPSKTVIGLCPP